ncbi:MAG TPA: hypothetical protein VEN30_26405, partial [Paraburkholderia sp.]|nr:hypothetical protein [Paraburkholderia sp.]
SLPEARPRTGQPAVDRPALVEAGGVHAIRDVRDVHMGSEERDSTGLGGIARNAANAEPGVSTR